MSVDWLPNQRQWILALLLEHNTLEFSGENNAGSETTRVSTLGQISVKLKEKSNKAFCLTSYHTLQ